MSRSNFVQTTVMNLDNAYFKELRDILVENYLPLAIAGKEDLTPIVLSEKLCDYFEMVEMKTDKSFEKIIEKYTLDLDSVISKRIAKEPERKKNKPTPPTPRAREYYIKSCYLRKHNKESKHGLLDFTRIALCLYSAILNSSSKIIDDFNYSLNELNLIRIIESLKEETILLGKLPKFVTKDPYESDRSTFILLVIMFYYMKSKEIRGEY